MGDVLYVGKSWTFVTLYFWALLASFFENSTN